jgi:prephenate dehydrogenase
VVAATLVNALDDAALQCVGPGFVDLTRIASSDPGLWTDICAENREPIAAALCGTADRLKELAQSLRQGDIEALRRHFQQAKNKRDSIQPCVGR